ncbi:hypothetical protein V7128_07470 [Neobacillus vireti]|uniref:hypothetical protein n=1 Tax=Neobacillus vireti TaxID=220686 RepID=UPI002FFF7B1C
MSDIKPVKLALLGEIRAGKDTVAQIISHELNKLDTNNHVQFLAFANGIHKVIEQFFPDAYKQGKPRKHLQHIGQSFRELNPDIWVDMLFNSIPYQIAKEHKFHILVTDVRQPNEAKRLQEEGFKVIKITASKEVRIARMKAQGDNFNPEDLEHETEKVVHQCPYDYLIDNSFSIDVLEQRINGILKEVLA